MAKTNTCKILETKEGGTLRFHQHQLANNRPEDLQQNRKAGTASKDKERGRSWKFTGTFQRQQNHHQRYNLAIRIPIVGMGIN